MNSTANETAGKTAKKGSTPSSITVVSLIVSMLRNVGLKFKKVGGDFVSEADIKKFVNTLLALSDVGPYDTILTVDGIAYPLSDFKVDTRLAAALLPPRQVVMAEPSPYRKDVRVHYSTKAEWSPAQMMEFQYQFLGMLKVQPSFSDILDRITMMPIGEVGDVLKADQCHVQDLAAVKSLPIELTIASEFWGEGYFNIPLSKVIEVLVFNLYSQLVSPSN
jgi:hypothetical protein